MASWTLATASSAGIVDGLVGVHPVLTWALSVAAVGLVVAALMVRVQTPEESSTAAATWTVLIVVVPILGPVIYLSREAIGERRARRRPGGPTRPVKGPVERYPPEEVRRRRDRGAGED